MSLSSAALPGESFSYGIRFSGTERGPVERVELGGAGLVDVDQTRDVLVLLELLSMKA